MNEATKLEGRCLCGEVQITVNGSHESQPGACHCRMCQRWSGGVFLAFSAAPESVTVTGPVTRFQSSHFAERAFCSKCGSHLWMHDLDGDAATYDLMPGLFDAAHDWPLRSEIYVDKAMKAIRLEGEHSRTTEAAYEAQHPKINAPKR